MATTREVLTTHAHEEVTSKHTGGVEINTPPLSRVAINPGGMKLKFIRNWYNGGALQYEVDHEHTVEEVFAAKLIRLGIAVKA